MTGYGKSQSQIKNKSILVEIRSLNSKNIDIIFRMPNAYREKEAHFRNLVSETLTRGKIELFITVDYSDGVADYSLNRVLFKKYYSELKSLSAELDSGNIHSEIFTSILSLPDILKTETTDISDDEWNTLEKNICEALEKTDKCRLSEGKHLEKDLRKRINIISKLLKNIEPYEHQRIENVKQKMLNNLRQLKIDSDTGRFEQELVYYLEKLDITEEKVRLEKHFDYFNEVLNSHEAGNGKKLGFIAQEINREINTISSKASDANIQKIVVQMKDELEKIKEQLFNIL